MISIRARDTYRDRSRVITGVSILWVDLPKTITKHVVDRKIEGIS